jgi:outer membrane lipoprotein
MRRALLLLATSALAACARPPLELRGEGFSPITVVEAQNEDRSGERVRWGGTIAATRPERDATCVEVVSLPLDVRTRPRRTDRSFGRFLACAPGFYDPEIYAPRREVTVVGSLDGREHGRVDDYDYTFPIVRAEAIHLWPERLDERRMHYGVGVGPPWYPYWWGWWGPSYYGRGPIIHHRRHR